MGFIQSTNLSDLQVSAQEIPSEGPRAVPIILDFSVQASYTIDLTQQQVQTRLSMVQTIYIDLADTDNKITVLVENSLHRVKAKGRTEGFYPLLAPSPTRLVISSSGTDMVTVHLINVPIAGVVWPTQ